MSSYKKVGTVKKRKGVTPGDILVRKVKGNKYIAFRLTHQNKPRVVGLTVPLSKTELKKEFNIKF